MSVMVENNPILNITSLFIDLVSLFQKKYVDDKVINKDLYSIFKEIDEQANNFLDESNIRFNNFKSNLSEIKNRLEDIKNYKKNINNLNEKMMDANLDNDEYLNINDEIRLLKEKVSKINDIEKEKEKIEKKIFDINEVNNFIDNVNLFSKLLYSLIKIYDENIKEDEFDEINIDLLKSESTALINMMKIIKYKYYKNMPYENDFINDFFNIHQFYTLLTLSNNSLKLMNYGEDQQNKQQQIDIKNILIY